MSVWIDVLRLTAKHPGRASTVPFIRCDALSVLVGKQLLRMSPAHPVCRKIGKLPREGEPPVPLSCIRENLVISLSSDANAPCFSSGFLTSAIAFAIPSPGQ